MKPFILIGNYNNGIRFVFGDFDTLKEAEYWAKEHLKRDSLRSSRGARLTCIISEAAYSYTSKEKKNATR